MSVHLEGIVFDLVISHGSACHLIIFLSSHRLPTALHLRLIRWHTSTFRGWWIKYKWSVPACQPSSRELMAKCESQHPGKGTKCVQDWEAELCAACGVLTVFPAGHRAFQVCWDKYSAKFSPAHKQIRVPALQSRSSCAGFHQPWIKCKRVVVQQCQHELHLWQKTHLGAKKISG